MGARTKDQLSLLVAFFALARTRQGVEEGICLLKLDYVLLHLKL